jgi:hypothetical protein
MAGEEEDLVVTLGEPPEPAPPAEGAVAKPPPVPGPPPPAAAVADQVTPEVGLKDLEQQIAAERKERARIAETARRLQTERDQAVQYAQEAERRGGTNYEAFVDSQIQGMTGELDALAARSESAMNDGDFKTAAEINKRIGRLGGALAVAEREKFALQQQREAQAKQPPPAPRQQTPPPAAQPAQPTTPLERAIAGRSQPTKDFLRKHPDLVRNDGTLKATAVQAHEKALDAGFVVDTDSYFRHIEQLLGGNGQMSQGDGQPIQPVIPGYSAPVQRGPTIGGDSLSPGTFRMTPKMRRLADEQGVTPQEWANNYVRLLKEGRITPIT